MPPFVWSDFLTQIHAVVREDAVTLLAVGGIVLALILQGRRQQRQQQQLDEMRSTFRQHLHALPAARYRRVEWTGEER